MDHGELNVTASAASAREAKRMGLRPGDEVANGGGSTYRIVEMVVWASYGPGPRRPAGVYAKLVAEHGHFVQPPEREVALDMRQPGWVRLLREDTGATGACGADEMDGAPGAIGVPNESRGSQ